MEESLQRFDRALIISLPLLLLLASVGGWWMSARALAPVDRITREADSISIGNLSARVPVPATKDELHRLARTLNEMLGRIEAAVLRMTQFTADASHELRAPLTLIRTAADFSLRGERSREDLVEAMRKIARESARSTNLVDNLLVLARADFAADPIELRDVDLVRIAQWAHDEMRLAAQEKQIDLTLQAPEESLRVKGDEDSLIRLIVILLDNAVKYTNPGGRVGMEVRLNGSDAEVSVTDTGIGIDSEQLPRIWDRFWRADKVRSRSMGGAGLGLSIAREIATRHGGVVEAESALGRGSRFSLRLRAARITNP
jgi:signal transduction histidine kinase